MHSLVPLGTRTAWLMTSSNTTFSIRILLGESMNRYSKNSHDSDEDTYMTPLEDPELLLKLELDQMESRPTDDVTRLFQHRSNSQSTIPPADTGSSSSYDRFITTSQRTKRDRSPEFLATPLSFNTRGDISQPLKRVKTTTKFIQQEEDSELEPFEQYKYQNTDLNEYLAFQTESSESNSQAKNSENNVYDFQTDSNSQKSISIIPSTPDETSDHSESPNNYVLGTPTPAPAMPNRSPSQSYSIGTTDTHDIDTFPNQNHLFGLTLESTVSKAKVKSYFRSQHPKGQSHPKHTSLPPIKYKQKVLNKQHSLIPGATYTPSLKFSRSKSNPLHDFPPVPPPRNNKTTKPFRPPRYKSSSNLPGGPKRLKSPPREFPNHLTCSNSKSNFVGDLSSQQIDSNSELDGYNSPSTSPHSHNREISEECRLEMDRMFPHVWKWLTVTQMENLVLVIQKWNLRPNQNTTNIDLLYQKIGQRSFDSDFNNFTEDTLGDSFEMDWIGSENNDPDDGLAPNPNSTTFGRIPDQNTNSASNPSTQIFAEQHVDSTINFAQQCDYQTTVEHDVLSHESRIPVPHTIPIILTIDGQQMMDFDSILANWVFGPKLFSLVFQTFQRAIFLFLRTRISGNWFKIQKQVRLIFRFSCLPFPRIWTAPSIKSILSDSRILHGQPSMSFLPLVRIHGVVTVMESPFRRRWSRLFRHRYDLKRWKIHRVYTEFMEDSQTDDFEPYSSNYLSTVRLSKSKTNGDIDPTHYNPYLVEDDSGRTLVTYQWLEITDPQMMYHGPRYSLTFPELDPSTFQTINLDSAENTINPGHQPETIPKLPKIPPNPNPLTSPTKFFQYENGVGVPKFSPLPTDSNHLNDPSEAEGGEHANRSQDSMYSINSATSTSSNQTSRSVSSSFISKIQNQRVGLYSPSGTPTDFQPDSYITPGSNSWWETTNSYQFSGYSQSIRCIMSDELVNSLKVGDSVTLIGRIGITPLDIFGKTRENGYGVWTQGFQTFAQRHFRVLGIEKTFPIPLITRNSFTTRFLTSKYSHVPRLPFHSPLIASTNSDSAYGSDISPHVKLSDRLTLDFVLNSLPINFITFSTLSGGKLLRPSLNDFPPKSAIGTHTKEHSLSWPIPNGVQLWQHFHKVVSPMVDNIRNRFIQKSIQYRNSINNGAPSPDSLNPMPLDILFADFCFSLFLLTRFGTNIVHPKHYLPLKMGLLLTSSSASPFLPESLDTQVPSVFHALSNNPTSTQQSRDQKCPKFNKKTSKSPEKSPGTTNSDTYNKNLKRLKNSKNIQTLRLLEKSKISNGKSTTPWNYSPTSQLKHIRRESVKPSEVVQSTQADNSTQSSSKDYKDTNFSGHNSVKAEISNIIEQINKFSAWRTVNPIHSLIVSNENPIISRLCKYATLLTPKSWTHSSTKSLSPHIQVNQKATETSWRVSPFSLAFASGGILHIPRLEFLFRTDIDTLLANMESKSYSMSSFKDTPTFHYQSSCIVESQLFPFHPTFLKNKHFSITGTDTIHLSSFLSPTQKNFGYFPGGPPLNSNLVSRFTLSFFLYNSDSTVFITEPLARPTPFGRRKNKTRSTSVSSVNSVNSTTTVRNTRNRNRSVSMSLQPDADEHNTSTDSLENLSAEDKFVAEMAQHTLSTLCGQSDFGDLYQIKALDDIDCEISDLSWRSIIAYAQNVQIRDFDSNGIDLLSQYVLSVRERFPDSGHGPLLIEDLLGIAYNNACISLRRQVSISDILVAIWIFEESYASYHGTSPFGIISQPNGQCFFSKALDDGSCGEGDFYFPLLKQIATFCSLANSFCYSYPTPRTENLSRSNSQESNVSQTPQ